MPSRSYTCPGQLPSGKPNTPCATLQILKAVVWRPDSPPDVDGMSGCWGRPRPHPGLYKMLRTRAAASTCIPPLQIPVASPVQVPERCCPHVRPLLLCTTLLVAHPQPGSGGTPSRRPRRTPTPICSEYGCGTSPTWRQCGKGRSPEWCADRVIKGAAIGEAEVPGAEACARQVQPQAPRSLRKDRQTDRKTVDKCEEVAWYSRIGRRQAQAKGSALC